MLKDRNEPITIPGIVVLKLKKHIDKRGNIDDIFDKDIFAAKTSFNLNIVSDEDAAD